MSCSSRLGCYSTYKILVLCYSNIHRTRTVVSVLGRAGAGWRRRGHSDRLPHVVTVGCVDRSSSLTQARGGGEPQPVGQCMGVGPPSNAARKHVQPSMTQHPMPEQGYYLRLVHQRKVRRGHTSSGALLFTRPSYDIPRPASPASLSSSVSLCSLANLSCLSVSHLVTLGWGPRSFQ